MKSCIFETLFDIRKLSAAVPKVQQLFYWNIDPNIPTDEKLSAVTSEV
jgi:hypothetical protein